MLCNITNMQKAQQPGENEEPRKAIRKKSKANGEDVAE